jgi:CheY-like chemotaxis protein
VAAAAVESARPGARAKEVALDQVLPPQPATVNGDAARLEQVLANLLSNAVKFTPRGGYVRMHLEGTGSAIHVRVVDNGEGIAPEFLPHVFDRFRQADSGRERQFGGLGLGLAIVRELVHAHGGTVSAESAGVGRGSTFEVVLPIRGVGAAAALAPVPSQTVSRAAIGGLHVLVVDDDPDARDLLAFALGAHGAEVATAPSAVAGFDALLKGRVDVLVADIGMPEEDGYSFVRRVRQLERDRGGSRVPAIAVTAYASSDDREQAFAAGFDVHLPKPVDPEALIRAIARLGTAAGV